MNKEMQELYDSINNMSILENLFESEFQQLEKKHVTLNDVFQNRQENINILLPGDVAILLTKFVDDEDAYCWYCVGKTKNGYNLANVYGDILHTQSEPYNYEQVIEWNKH